MTWQEIGILLTFLLGLWNLVFAFRNSRRTTFINTVTSERVRWIQNTRESISSLCGATYSWVSLHGSLTPKEAFGLRGEIQKQGVLVLLQLNPKGILEQELMSLVRSIPDYMHKYGEMPQLLNTIVEKSQVMLKEEWDKVLDESVHGNLRKRS